AVVPHLDAVRRWIASLRAPLRRVTIAAAPGGVAVSAIAGARPGAADRAASESALSRTAGLRGIVLSGGGERLGVGDPSVRVDLEPGVDLEVPVDASPRGTAGGDGRLA